MNQAGEQIIKWLKFKNASGTLALAAWLGMLTMIIMHWFELKEEGGLEPISLSIPKWLKYIGFLPVLTFLPIKNIWFLKGSTLLNYLLIIVFIGMLLSLKSLGLTA